MKHQVELTDKELALVEEFRKNGDISGAMKYQPKALIYVEVEEKVEVYNRLYNLCIDTVATLQANGYLDEEVPHYMYEEVMTGCLGPDIFEDVINPLLK